MIKREIRNNKSMIKREIRNNKSMIKREIRNNKSMIKREIRNNKAQRTAISPLFFQNICFSLNLTVPVEPDQNCTLPGVKNGKIRNTSCLISNLNILGYKIMHILSIRTFVPSQMVSHPCIRKLKLGHKHVYSDHYMSCVTLTFGGMDPGQGHVMDGHNDG